MRINKESLKARESIIDELERMRRQSMGDIRSNKNEISKLVERQKFLKRRCGAIVELVRNARELLDVPGEDRTK